MGTERKSRRPNDGLTWKRAVMQMAAFFALLGIMFTGMWWWKRTYHFAAVQQGVLYRDGVRSAREFGNSVEVAKPKLIVSLIDDAELADPGKPEFKAEMELLKEKGIRVERIPIKLGGWPTTEDVKRFLELVDKKENQPVMVHCAQGVRRTGMMVAAYQLTAMGLDKQKAKESILRFGHSDRSIGDVQRFIDVYDVKSGEVTKALEMSVE